MKSFEEQLKELASQCFDIESQLPMFEVFDENNSQQEFRRSLYRLRIEIGVNQQIAKKIDAEVIATNEEFHRKWIEEMHRDFCPECFQYECNCERN
jgi:hypothetical protein